jgi:membrane associated rhomboid family serine protease
MEKLSPAVPAVSVADPQRHSRWAGYGVVAWLLGAMWLVEIINAALHDRLDAYGIVPRNTTHLDGIIFSPFLHESFQHLIDNSIPLAALGAVLALSGARRVLSVTAFVILVGGFALWLVGPRSDIVGASGLVFGWAGYLMVRGLVSRNALHLLLGLAVLLVFGATLVISLIPHHGISWQAHALGGIAGALAAVVFDHRHSSASRAASR